MTEPDRVDQDAARGKEPEHGAGETDDARGLGGMSFLEIMLIWVAETALGFGLFAICLVLAGLMFVRAIQGER